MRKGSNGCDHVPALTCGIGAISLRCGMAGDGFNAAYLEGL